MPKKNPKTTRFVDADETVRNLLEAVGYTEEVENVEVTISDGRTGGLMPLEWGVTYLVRLDGLDVVDLVDAAASGDDQAYQALNQGVVMSPGIAVVQLSSTGGEYFDNPRIIVHPKDFAPRMLSADDTPEITAPEGFAIVIAKQIVPDYAVQWEHWSWDMRAYGGKRSEAAFREVYDSLIAKGLAKDYGVLTTAGKNLYHKIKGNSIQASYHDVIEYVEQQ